MPLRGRPSESLQTTGLRLMPFPLGCDLVWEQPEPLSDSGQEEEEDVRRWRRSPGPPNPESGSETRERSGPWGRCHTQYWFFLSWGWLRSPERGGAVLPSGGPGCPGKSLDDLGKGGRRGGSERWVPEDSDSQSGITRNAGRLGGIDEDGDVSLLRLLSIQESESDTA